MSDPFLSALLASHQTRLAPSSEHAQSRHVHLPKHLLCILQQNTEYSRVGVYC